MNISHPITLGFSLIWYSIIIGFFLRTKRISWFFYLLVLVFLGGVIVLIIYMCTLSANEKFMGGPLISFLRHVIIFSLLLFIPTHISNVNKFILSESAVYVLYENLILRNTIFLILYLIITIVVVVKLVKFETGPIIKRL